jgi:hypothetical protein
MKVSRRRLVQVLTAAVAVEPEAAAQTPAGDAELEGARQYQRLSVQIVRQVQLPMSTEPAVKFTPRS